MRSGNELEAKVKSLEVQISEQEAESSRLLRLIDVQKESATSAEQSARRRLEETLKDLSARVRLNHLICGETTSLICQFFR